MGFEKMLNDSVEYTTEALIRNKRRWLTFFILNLPFALLPLAIKQDLLEAAMKSKAFVPSMSFFLSLVRWEILVPLLVTGIIFSVFVSGYIVRVYRGTTPIPDFSGWGDLFLDGIRLWVVHLFWLMPVLALVALQLAVAFSSFETVNFSLLIIMILLLPVVLALAIMTTLFDMVGSVRYARTESVREGVRFHEILAHIRTIGWLNLIAAVIILIILGFCINFVIGIASVIPYSQMILNPLLMPFFTILSARFISQVYDSGQAGPQEAGGAPVQPPWTPEQQKDTRTIVYVLIGAGVIFFGLIAVSLLVMMPAFTMAGHVEKPIVIAATAIQQGNNIIVTYWGGQDAEKVESLDIAVNKEKRTIFSPKVNDTWTFAGGTGGRDPVKVTAHTSAGAEQIILDMYV